MKRSTKCMLITLAVLLLASALGMLWSTAVQVLKESCSSDTFLTVVGLFCNIASGAFCSIAVSLVAISYQAVSERDEHVAKIIYFVRRVSCLISSGCMSENYDQFSEELGNLYEDFRFMRSLYVPLKNEDDLDTLVSSFVEHMNSNSKFDAFKDKINEKLQAINGT